MLHTSIATDLNIRSFVWDKHEETGAANLRIQIWVRRQFLIELGKHFLRGGFGRAKQDRKFLFSKPKEVWLLGHWNI